VRLRREGGVNGRFGGENVGKYGEMWENLILGIIQIVLGG